MIFKNCNTTCKKWNKNYKKKKRKNIALLTRLIRKVNDSLWEQCVSDGFGYISNDNISRTYLWKDEIHLEGLGTNILAGNFADFLNKLILSKPSEHSWLHIGKHLKGLYGNIGVLTSDNSLSSEIVSNWGGSRDFEKGGEGGGALCQPPGLAGE